MLKIFRNWKKGETFLNLIKWWQKFVNLKKEPLELKKCLKNLGIGKKSGKSLNLKKFR